MSLLDCDAALAQLDAREFAGLDGDLRFLCALSFELECVDVGDSEGRVESVAVVVRETISGVRAVGIVAIQTVSATSFAALTLSSPGGVDLRILAKKHTAEKEGRRCGRRVRSRGGGESIGARGRSPQHGYRFPF